MFKGMDIGRTVYESGLGGLQVRLCTLCKLGGSTNPDETMARS